MLRGKIGEGTVGIRVELNKDEVPDFDTEVGVHVYKGALAVALGSEVNVQLRAGTTGAGFAHHPEVVLFVAVDDMDLGVEPGFLKQDLPKIVGFLIELGGVALAGRVNRGVKAGGWKSPNLS